ncbi:hypothetical protein [Acidovorax sp. BLS4]|nr:hypothetical protein [Paracidovorax avenae]WOI45330.1 hypothetical protein R1Z03_22910 [Paracidovorax avenae]
MGAHRGAAKMDEQRLPADEAETKNKKGVRTGRGPMKPALPVGTPSS